MCKGLPTLYKACVTAVSAPWHKASSMKGQLKPTLIRTHVLLYVRRCTEDVLQRERQLDTGGSYSWLDLRVQSCMPKAKSKMPVREVGYSRPAVRYP